MASITRRIGLSLGADVCWPLCYEGILRRLDPKVRVGDDVVRFEVERVSIEPYALSQPCKYDVVLDRLTHWYHTTREWIKKAVVMDGLYVLNNPWAVQAMEKHTSYCAMLRLGMPIPETWMVPPKSYEVTPDLQPTLNRYARLFDLGKIGERIGYPLYMKPYDGGGWKAVTRARNEKELRAAYEASGKHVMHLQRAIEPFDRFVRCIGLGPQTTTVLYDPSKPLHDRYTMEKRFIDAEDEAILRETTLTINAFFGWDFNSCEALRSDGVWFPIDFANPCPDSQVTSLHYHFPWLVKANIRWSLYCAATRRKMRPTLDWEPFFEVAASGQPYRERLRQYARIAEERLEAARFDEFCARELTSLDEIAWEFFGTDEARQAVRAKVEAMYPAHEVAAFTELFWRRIQDWRNDAGRVAS